jgi:hypothetical protein
MRPDPFVSPVYAKSYVSTVGVATTMILPAIPFVRKKACREYRLPAEAKQGTGNTKTIELGIEKIGNRSTISQLFKNKRFFAASRRGVVGFADSSFRSLWTGVLIMGLRFLSCLLLNCLLMISSAHAVFVTYTLSGGTICGTLGGVTFTDANYTIRPIPTHRTSFLERCELVPKDFNWRNRGIRL